MSPVMLAPSLKITEVHAKDFVIAISKALIHLEINDLQQVYLFHDRAVVISYAGDYQPFIGFTMSYNDPEYRLYINQAAFVLNRIAEALELQGRDIPGGRVFIERGYAYIKDLEYRHQVIILLDWQGFNPYEEVKAAYSAIIKEASK